MEAQVVAAVVGPLTTALLAASSVALSGRRLRRQNLSSRTREIQVAGQTVVFVNDYLSAQQKLCPTTTIAPGLSDRARRDLEQAYTVMMLVIAADHAAPAGPLWSLMLKRALLRSVHRPAAKVVRALFYLLLALGLLLSAIGLSAETQDQTLNWAQLLLVNLLLAAVMLLPAGGFYWWARWLDRDRQPAAAAPTPAPAPPSLQPWPPPSGLPMGDGPSF